MFRVYQASPPGTISQVVVLICRGFMPVQILAAMDFRPVLASTASLLRKSSTIQRIRRTFNRRSMAAPEMCWPKPMRAIGAQNLLTMPGGVSISGYLHKKGGSQFSLLKWPLRYVILHKGCVYYFKSSTSACPQGAFSLNGYNRVMRAAEETTSSNVFPFKIVHFSKKHRTWLFSAASEEERRKWMRGLRKEIDYYNDRRESLIPSDDSDGESFYGSIERPMDIKTSADNTEEDYTEDEDDEEEEDYLTPDSDCATTSSTGKVMAPPPSYPPPPVPVPVLVQARLDKGPPALLGRGGGPHPPLTGAPSSITPPPPPPPITKLRKISTAESSAGAMDLRALKSLGSMTICDQLKGRKFSNGPPHPFPGVEVTHSLGNSRPAFMAGPPHPFPGVEVTHSLGNSRPAFMAGPPALPPPNAAPPTKPLAVSPKLGKPDLKGRTRAVPSCPPPLSLPPFSPHLVAQPKPPDDIPHMLKPPLPPAKPNKHGGSPLQRASPDGQSFRNSVDEVPADCKKKQNQHKNSGGDSDDDYENIHLPDSVFIDTTETILVERLFKESSTPPHNGLYGIRNSGTKTSKVLVVWDVSFGKARNYRVFEEEQNMYLDRDVTFPSLAALIEHYYSHPLPHHNSLCLQRPYGYNKPRPR